MIEKSDSAEVCRKNLQLELKSKTYD